MKTKDINHDMCLCSGCEACASSCTHGALTMSADWRGFRYPQIDNNICVDCGLCSKTCPVNDECKPFAFPYTKAFVENDKGYLANASSGGAFGVIARYILGKGGIVFGACMDDNYDVNYMGVETIGELPKIQGSKYVQAYVGDVYRQVRQALKAGRYVLFCGCPCQVDGLKHYLRKDYDLLLTMDLICHGVPSQPYFKAYVKDLLRRKARQGITTFRFRWKPETCCETPNTAFIKKLYLGFHNKDFYMTYFLWGKGYRESCYSCRYAGGARPADFTIGDFWMGHPAIDSKWGASQVLFNTSRAKSLSYLFDNAGTTADLSSLEEAIGSDGGQLSHPSHYDFRCKLIYVLWRMFGLGGPKALFFFDNLRMKRKL